MPLMSPAKMWANLLCLQQRLHRWAGDYKRSDSSSFESGAAQCEWREEGEKFQSLARLGRPSVFVHRHLHKATQRGLCVVRNTQSFSRSWLSKFDSIYSSPVSPLLCLSSSPVIPSCFQLSSTFTLLSLLSPGWIIHGGWLCQTAGAPLIQKDTFHSGLVCSVVHLWGLVRHVWVGGLDNGKVGAKLLWQPLERVWLSRKKEGQVYCNIKEKHFRMFRGCKSNCCCKLRGSFHHCAKHFIPFWRHAGAKTIKGTIPRSPTHLMPQEVSGFLSLLISLIFIQHKDACLLFCCCCFFFLAAENFYSRKIKSVRNTAVVKPGWLIWFCQRRSVLGLHPVFLFCLMKWVKEAKRGPEVRDVACKPFSNEPEKLDNERIL